MERCLTEGGCSNLRRFLRALNYTLAASRYNYLCRHCSALVVSFAQINSSVGCSSSEGSSELQAGDV